jgi:outer membrane protein assembly complex protein YaeT
MMWLLVFSAALWAADPTVNTPVAEIRSVQVVGNRRFPTTGFLRLLKLSEGKTFDEKLAGGDLRTVYNTGFFEDVVVDTRTADDGRVDVFFRVREYPFVSGFEIEGLPPNLEERVVDMLREKRLEPQPASPFNPGSGAKAAAAVRGFLVAHKYPQAQVEVRPEVESTPGLVRVAFRVEPGPRLEVGPIEFSGNETIPDKDLLSEMEYTRSAPFWAVWSGRGTYVPEKLHADLQRVRRLYQSRGFAAVQVGPACIYAQSSDSGFPLTGSKPELRILVPIVEGPSFTLSSVRVEGDARAADAKITELVGRIAIPGHFDGTVLEATRQEMIQALGNAGYALADVRLEQALDDVACTVESVFKVAAGTAAAIGKIRFEGNSRIPDKFLRRELRISEGELFDSTRLDESIERLNRSNLVEEVDRADVALEIDEATQELDVTFKVKEVGRQGIYGTGGMAGGGYLGVLYSVFNLFGLGEKLTLELDGGAAQSNFLLDLAGRHFLGSPFSVGLSAFHRLTNINVSGIVPDSRDVIGVFRRRSTGVGLSGTYPVTSRIHIGLGYQDEIRDIAREGQPESRFARSEVSPMFVLDDSRGTGPATRGYRATLARSWTGTGFFESVQAAREAFEVSTYLDDPWGRKNSLAFRLQGAIAHSGGRPLAEDLRFYPGTELARGFPQGGLTAWSLPAGGSASNLTPAGADTYFGFSAEYRVPIHGALSGAAFLDAAWTRLGTTTSDGPAAVLRKTSGILRASMGGELRVQLPVIRQPARLVFAWNPLRLDRLIDGAPSFRVADPRGAVRFILGGMF